MRWGIRFEGTGERFAALFLDQAYAAIQTRGEFSFFEIGTAESYTFSMLCSLLKREGLDRQSTMVSCDLPNGWSLDHDKLVANMNAAGMAWAEMRDRVMDSLHTAPPIGPGYATIVYHSGRELIGALSKAVRFSPDFVFIDGCHGSPCVCADFTAVEPHVAHGGVVAFHDACLASQGQDWQGHCGEMISVRQALKELGLLDGTRPGWTTIGEIEGDRARGGEGHGHFVVRRTA